MSKVRNQQLKDEVQWHYFIWQITSTNYWDFVVVAGSTVLTTIPIYCEPAHFDSAYCLSIRFFLIIFKKKC